MRHAALMVLILMISACARQEERHEVHDLPRLIWFDRTDGWPTPRPLSEAERRELAPFLRELPEAVEVSAHPELQEDRRSVVVRLRWKAPAESRLSWRISFYASAGTVGVFSSKSFPPGQTDYEYTTDLLLPGNRHEVILSANVAEVPRASRRYAYLVIDLRNWQP